ncbi:MAG: hypothetical protein AAB790_00345 [Patescibacteria group bacterium]
MVFRRFIPLATVFLTFVVFTVPVLRAVMWWRDSTQVGDDAANMLSGVILFSGGLVGFDANKRILPFFQRILTAVKNVVRRFKK